MSLLDSVLRASNASEYTETLKKIGIDAFTLKLLSDDDLKLLGIDDEQTRNSILEHATNLQIPAEGTIDIKIDKKYILVVLSQMSLHLEKHLASISIATHRNDTILCDVRLNPAAKCLRECVFSLEKQLNLFENKVTANGSDVELYLRLCPSNFEQIQRQTIQVETINSAKMFEVSDTQKIGVGLAGFGVFFLFLGVLLLFDKSLLALGNILFIAGLACVIGLERTFRFFFQRHKIKASLAFFGGIIIVLVGWPIVGMIFETYGFVLLFSGFFPVAINFLRRVPLLGTILNFPGISRLVDKLAGNTNRTTV